MRRREFIAGLGSAAAWPNVAGAQQPNMPVIGYLDGGSIDTSRETAAGVRRVRDRRHCRPTRRVTQFPCNRGRARLS
jgi:hypothetical protein